MLLIKILFFGKHSRKEIHHLLFFVLMLFTGYAEGDDAGVDAILEGIHSWYSSQLAEIPNMMYLAKSVYRELNKEGEIVEEIIALRRIHTHDSDQEREQYIAMNKNGYDLDEQEMKSEIQRWQKMGKRRGSTKMPFDPAWEEAYNFILAGTDTLDSRSVWRIVFEAKKDADEYIDGTAYVRQDNFHILRLEATSSKLPSVIKKMDRVYTYTDINGYVLPAAFEMELHVKVKFIITFADKHIVIEDHYSDYRFDTGEGDSLLWE
ncbi:MAG: hypothetical protein JSW02_08875 [candidate division WOR-3 bacterium]|nr:MAG: hypothetical protein JSW02_08875 [candidate division WOR-3 bacterium]